MGLFHKNGAHYKKRALWKRIVIWTLISVFATALVVGLAGFIFVYHTLGKIDDDTEVVYEAKAQLDVPLPDEPMNVLILGEDQDPDGTSKRSDTIMLARINPDGECISILSIPRDLIVNIPGVGPDKINSAYAIGGIPLAIDTMRELTDQPIHHFVLVDYTGFEQAVDALGGVFVDVDKRYFNDNSAAYWGEFYEPIDINPGYQKLNGHDSLAYVRFRHTDSDFMRIARQQYFIRDAKSQSIKWGNLTKIPELADIFASNTTSDVGRNDVLSLTKFLLTINRDHIFQAQPPVIDNPGYLTLDRQAFSQVISQFINPVFYKPEPAVPGAPPPQAPLDAVKQLKIEVLNGSEIEGAASQAADLLGQKGIKGITVGGNALNSYVENQIFYRDSNQAAAATELCSLLQPCMPSQMTQETYAATTSQLLVVIGSSFPGHLTEKQAPVQPALHFQENSADSWDEWKVAAQQLSFPIQKPSSFPVEFDYLDFRPYEIQTDDGAKQAIKIVGEDEVGNNWGIMETTFVNAPLLNNPTLERNISGKTYRFYYAGDKLRYLAWQDGNVAIWISNSLQNSLTEETVIQLALSFKPV